MTWDQSDQHDLFGRKRRTALAGIAVLLALLVIVAITVTFLNVDFVESDNRVARPRPPGTTPTQPTSEPTSDGTTPTTEPTKKKPPEPRDVLSAPSSAGANQRIDLTGRFQGVGPGVYLQVQRKEGGSWTPFPVTMSTDADGSFSTWILTGRSGMNMFRVAAPDIDRATNPVKIQIS